MIDLNIGKDQEVFQEGLLGDALKAADVNVDRIKDDWSNSATGIGDKLDTINSEGLGRAKDELKRIDKTLGKGRVDSRSIIARARNSVLQFPIYMTQSCPINPANTIAKAWERVYVSYVQAVLAANPIISEDEANDLVFLKRFHTNLTETAETVLEKYTNLINEFYEPIDDMDRMMVESIFHRERISDNCYVEFRVVPTDDQYLIQENARLLNEPLTGLSYLMEDNKGASEVSSERSGSAKAVSEDDLRQMARDEADLTEDEKKAVDTDRRDFVQAYDDTHTPPPKSKVKEYKQYQDDRTEAIRQYQDDRQSGYDKINDAIDDIKSELRKPRGSRDPKYHNYFLDGGRVMHTSTSRKDVTKVNSGAVDAPRLLRDVDIKKLNNALPYSMEVTFRMRTQNGNLTDVRFIVNVKTVMHMIRAQDLADDLQELISGDMQNLRKVRYKTGEINFLDYLLNIKELKADAAKNINHNKKWINTLKRLGEYKKLHGSLLKKPVEALTGGNVPLPNGTLVLTQPDVTMLTSQTGIDLSKVSNARKLGKNLFLMSIIIVDASSGTLRVLYPEVDGDWDVQSLASIDAETAKTDNSQLMRELNRMVNR